LQVEGEEMRGDERFYLFIYFLKKVGVSRRNKSLGDEMMMLEFFF
jgi:hypothetical protein